jgi:hypothetical protein
MSTSKKSNVNIFDAIFDNTDSEQGVYGSAPGDGCNFIDLLQSQPSKDKYTAHDILNMDYSQQTAILPEKLEEFTNSDELLEDILGKDYTEKDPSKEDILEQRENLFFKKRDEYLILKQLHLSTVKTLIESDKLQDNPDDYGLFDKLQVKLTDEAEAVLTKMLKSALVLAKEIDNEDREKEQTDEEVIAKDVDQANKQEPQYTLDDYKQSDAFPMIDDNNYSILSGLLNNNYKVLYDLEDRYNLLHNVPEYNSRIEKWNSDQEAFAKHFLPPPSNDADIKIEEIEKIREYSSRILTVSAASSYMLDIMNTHINRHIYLFMDDIINDIAINCCTAEKIANVAMETGDIIKYVLTERIRLYMKYIVQPNYDKTYREIINEIVYEFITNGSYLVTKILYHDNKSLALEQQTNMINYINELSIAVPAELDILYNPLPLQNNEEDGTVSAEVIGNIEKSIMDIAGKIFSQSDSGLSKSDLHSSTTHFIELLDGLSSNKK